MKYKSIRMAAGASVALFLVSTALVHPAVALKQKTESLSVRAVHTGKAEVVDEQHVSVTLIPEVSKMTDSDTVMVGVHMKIREGWHVYWRNPGDSGLPTRISWDDHPLLEPGEIKWPQPARFDEDGVTTYGYSNHVTLLVPMHVKERDRSGETHYEHLEAYMNWLVCKDICISESDRITLEIDGSGNFSGFDDDARKYIRKAEESLPSLSKAWSAKTRFDGAEFVITLSPEQNDARFPDTDELYFFPYEQGRIDHSSPQDISREGDKLKIRMKASRYLSSAPDTIRGVVSGMQSWVRDADIKSMEIQSDVIESLD